MNEGEMTPEEMAAIARIKGAACGRSWGSPKEVAADLADAIVAEIRRAVAADRDASARMTWRLMCKAIDDTHARYEGGEIAVTDALVEQIDGLLLADDLPSARTLLASLDPKRLPPMALSAVMMVTKAASAALGAERAAFVDRARVALSETWGLSPEQVAAICHRHE